MVERETDFLRTANEGMMKTLQQYISIRDSGKRILGTHDIDQIAHLLRNSIEETLRFEKIELYLLDADQQHYTAVGNGAAALRPDDTVIDWVFNEDKPTTVPHGESLITVVPMSFHQRRVGILCIDTTEQTDTLSTATLETLYTLTGQAAAAILNVHLLAQVQDQLTLLQNILEGITNGIVTLDSQQRIARVNRNAMAMLDIPPESVGKELLEILPPDLRQPLEEMMRETEDLGFAMERMVNRRSAQGTELPLAIGISPLRDDSAANLGLIVVFRDMTASRELERLRRLDQMKTEFIANVSHELRTPLTSIKAYTEALQDMAAEDTQKQFLGVIQEESDRLLFLINDLLNVSRIQSGKINMHFEIVEPKVILTEILNISKVQSQKHKLTVDIEENLPRMLLDKEKMKEVMINLISNAIKYSPKGGNVWARLKNFENNLRIEVQDEGMGIAPEHQSKVFDQFYRVDTSLTYEIQGTGLGLAIVKAIIDAQGGKVWVESQVGVGSTFIVLIPIRQSLSPGEAGSDTMESFV